VALIQEYRSPPGFHYPVGLLYGSAECFDCQFLRSFHRLDSIDSLDEQRRLLCEEETQSSCACGTEPHSS
jgi:hypothetical protein